MTRPAIAAALILVYGTGVDREPSMPPTAIQKPAENGVESAIVRPVIARGRIGVS